MFINSKNGCIASGTVGTVDGLTFVGERQSPTFKFSIAAGKDASDQTIWINCRAWRNLAEYLGMIGLVKGDSVCVTGRWDTYKGNNEKVYNTLVIDWINKVEVPALTGARPVSPKPAPDFEEISINEEELPF